MMILEYGTLLMKTRDQGGLAWPKNDVVALCGIVVTTFSNLISNNDLMNAFRASSTSSRVGLKATRDMIDLKINNHHLFKN